MDRKSTATQKNDPLPLLYRKWTMKNKSMHRKAEVAAEHWLQGMGCLETRRCLRTQFNKVDFFGADVVGCLPTGAKIYIQVTTGGKAAVSQRRKKLSSRTWHESETVILAQMYTTKGKRGRFEYWFQAQELSYRNPNQTKRKGWIDWGCPVLIPREWFEVKGLTRGIKNA